MFFTTIHKFVPLPGEKEQTVPSDLRNIVVIGDEAHRSQYDFLDGLAPRMRHGLPRASFIGSTATPIELKDANTRAGFGDCIQSLLHSVAATSSLQRPTLTRTPSGETLTERWETRKMGA